MKTFLSRSLHKGINLDVTMRYFLGSLAFVCFDFQQELLVLYWLKFY